MGHVIEEVFHEGYTKNINIIYIIIYIIYSSEFSIETYIGCSITIRLVLDLEPWYKREVN